MIWQRGGGGRERERGGGEGGVLQCVWAYWHTGRRRVLLLLYVCVREHVWIMPAVICMRGGEGVRESEPAWRAKIVFTLCMCASVNVRSCTSGNCGVPGSPVFTDRKCLSRQKGRNLAAPHGKHRESGHAHRHTETHTCKKRNLTGAPVFVSKVGYLVLGKWEWLGWALTVLHFPSRWLPMQTPADRKSIHWPLLNLWERGHGLPGLSTLMHTNWLYVSNVAALVPISAACWCSLVYCEVQRLHRHTTVLNFKAQMKYLYMITMYMTQIFLLYLFIGYRFSS